MNQAFLLSNPVSESQTSSLLQKTFFQFIWRSKINRRYLLIAVVGTIVQFVIFKMLYPFPDFFSDSYSYLYAAYANLDVSIWPIGYSKFLRWFHFFTYSDTALIAFQYFIFELGATYFYLTILYFFRPSKINRTFLFAFLFFNPLFLYLSNYVNSDPLFVALSLFWITQLIWVLFRPSLYQVLVQGILLFLCFTIRNNAYYYPAIGAIAFLLSRQNWKIKMTGVIFPLLLIIPFIIHTRNAAYKMMGSKQFSLFTGWQLANNALYMYNDISVESEDLPTSQTQELDSLSKNFYKTVIPEFQDYLSNYTGNFFIRQPDAPLKQYVSLHYNPKNGYEDVVVWGKASAVFADYGNYLIRKNPSAYIRNFMLLNAKVYFATPLEKLELYNLGADSVGSVAKYWFHFKNRRITAVSKEAQAAILFIFPPLFFLTNIYLIIWGLLFIVRRKFKNTSVALNRFLILMGGLLIANFSFCVFATIIVFRYQVFPLIICFTLSIMLLEWVNEKERSVMNSKAGLSKDADPGLLRGTSLSS